MPREERVMKDYCTRFLLGFFACYIALSGFAETETINGYTWKYQILGGRAIIAGNMWTGAAISPKPTGTIKIPEILGGLIVDYIGPYAFQDCQGLADITIPSHVRIVDYDAFSGCINLTNVVLEAGVESIGSFAFCDCGKLQTIEIPSSVTEISNGVFSNCSSLKDVILPDGLSTIAERLFNGCVSLTHIDIPPNASSIQDGAFYGCSSLSRVTIPCNVSNIGRFAFAGCDKLRSISVLSTCQISSDAVSSNTKISRYNVTVDVAFNPNGGNVTPRSTKVGYRLPYGQLPTPTRAGHTFLGWASDDTIVSSNSIVATTNEISLVALWEVNNYNLVFDANGGVGGTNIVQAYGTLFSVPEVCRTGYILSGWEPDLPSEMLVPAENTTFVAQWEPRYAHTRDATEGRPVGWDSI